MRAETGSASRHTLSDLASALVCKRLIAWDEVWRLSFAEVRMLAHFLGRARGLPPSQHDLSALMSAFPDTPNNGPTDERS